MRLRKMFAALAVLAADHSAAFARLPTEIARQLPSGYAVLAHVHVEAGKPIRNFEIIALGRKDEGDRAKTRDAPARPLLVFERKAARFVVLGRNDHVVFKVDDGGQCDPFLDGDATIAVKGRYFTVQNGVSCGHHWTDYITFRLDDHAGNFVFDNERAEAWTLNPSNDPNAEALVRDGKPNVIRDKPGQVTPFSIWRPAH